MEKIKEEIVIGIDEAGRGPWAGPVVASAVSLRKRLDGLKDSKTMSQKKRDEIVSKIKEKSFYGIGVVTSKEIDNWGIKKATKTAMLRAIQDLEESNSQLSISLAKIDGNDKFDLGVPTKDIIKGDTKINNIKAASIIAKTTRDEMMELYDKKYPEYGFKSHMGYGTKAHHAALIKHGPISIHRFSYKPIQKIVDEFENR
jgi:ribonuclease HII